MENLEGDNVYYYLKFISLPQSNFEISIHFFEILIRVQLPKKKKTILDNLAFKDIFVIPAKQISYVFIPFL